MKRLLWTVAFCAGTLALLRLLGYEVTIGGLVLQRSDIERWRTSGRKRKLIVLGGCVIGADVPADLFSQTVDSMLVIGGLVANEDVLSALGDRLGVIGGSAARQG